MEEYHSFAPGKLLLSGEYVVLDGALSYALKTKLGQRITVNPVDNDQIAWTSRSNSGTIWFEASFSLKDGSVVNSNTDSIASSLLPIIDQIRTKITSGVNIEMNLEFDRDWGLGSSSTMIALIAKAFGLDPFDLSEASFGGSGYDVAVGFYDRSMFYQLKEGNRMIKPYQWNPPFANQLFFVHLNRKQNSREGIASYDREKGVSYCLSEDMNALTEALVETDDLKEFESLIRTHEKIIAEIIGMKRIRESTFFDYPFEVKSLGAWGGDFCLAVGDDRSPDYFHKKGYNTVIPFEEMIG